MTLIFKSGYNTASIFTEGKDFETFYNEIETTIKDFYAKHTDRAPFYVQVERVYDDHREALIIGKRLSGDKTGRIMWETWTNEPYHKLLNRGYMDCSRYTRNAWYEIVNFIIKQFIGSYRDFEALIAEEEEAEMEAQTDDMYQYASEAAEEIENLVDSVDDAYSDIIAEMKHDDPDIEYAMMRVDDMYRRMVDIENELRWCLHRCDERTGCDIGWDDFCTADYFEPISIHGDWDCPSYSITEFINDYNCDAADFMNTLIENIWKALGGQNGDTFRSAIDDLDMPFYIAA